MTRRTPMPWLVLAAGLLAVSGCAGNRMYTWGDYDDTLYSHYKNPQDQEKHLERLALIVKGAEAEGCKVPPGLYAEYAFALHEAGRTDEAVNYFGKEKEKWPESSFVMDKMIRNVRRQDEIRKKAASPETGPTSDAGGQKQ